MNRAEKQNVIESLQNDFSKSNAAFLVGVKGLSVTQIQALRKDLRPQGGKLKITKARLMKIAANNVKEDILDPFFKDQIGVVFAGSEPSAIAKILYNFAKQNEALKIVAGSVEKQLFDKQLITRIAQLPSKEVLLAQLCGTLKAPIAKLAIVIDALAKKGSEQASV